MKRLATPFVPYAALIRPATRWTSPLARLGAAVLLAMLGRTAVRGSDLPPIVAPGAQLEEVYHAEQNFEGPSWDPKSQSLFFTAFGATRADTQVLRLGPDGHVSIWLDRSEGANGTILARSGRLLCAQSYGHRILSFDPASRPDQGRQVLLEDTTLNQPNDLCESADGTLYFTDPDFAAHRHSAVYLLRPAGERLKVADDLITPNGIALSADGRLLVVSDSEPRLWRCYPVKANGTLGPGRVFFDPPMPDRNEAGTKPDGLKVDADGIFFLTGRKGIWVVDPLGQELGFIPTPVFPSNVCFGGPDGRTLFITGHHRVFRVQLRRKSQ